MDWVVEYTDEFEQWWDTLDEDGQATLIAKVQLLQQFGPALRRPHADVIHGSRHSNMKELRAHTEAHEYRVLFAFDPRRYAILLLGGDKTGDRQWYDTAIPAADALSDEHLESLKREGLI